MTSPGAQLAAQRKIVKSPCQNRRCGKIMTGLKIKAYCSKACRTQACRDRKKGLYSLDN